MSGTRGQVLDGERYRIERRIGGGGMATVYRGFDEALERPVAVKLLAPHLAADEAFRERFLREARLAARLQHPNVVQIFDIGSGAEGPFIVMEHVEGTTLAGELAERGRFSAGEVIETGIQVCAALAAAHREGLVHRDVKPQNVLVRRADGQLKLTDFGIARAVAATHLTEPGTLLGTATYLAPEQARGEEVGAAADIYALGVLLYELLTGQPPFRAATLPELLAQREHATVTPPGELADGVPAALEAALLGCLARDPDVRPTAAALAAELAAVPRDPAARALAASAAETARLPVRRRAGNRLALVVTAAAAALVGAGIALALLLTGPTGSRHAQAAPRTAPATPTAAATTTPPPPTTAATTTATAAAPTPTTATTTAAAAPASTSATTTAPTTAAETTAATSTSAAASPDAAVAAAQAAVAQSVASGQLDPGAANDLTHRLDQLARTLAGGKPDTAHKLDELLRHLGDLARSGRITPAGLNQVGQPLVQLASLLQPAQTPNQNDQGGD